MSRIISGILIFFSFFTGIAMGYFFPFSVFYSLDHSDATIEHRLYSTFSSALNRINEISPKEAFDDSLFFLLQKSLLYDDQNRLYLNLLIEKMAHETPDSLLLLFQSRAFKSAPSEVREMLYQTSLCAIGDSHPERFFDFYSKMNINSNPQFIINVIDELANSNPKNAYSILSEDEFLNKISPMVLLKNDIFNSDDGPVIWERRVSIEEEIKTKKQFIAQELALEYPEIFVAELRSLENQGDAFGMIGSVLRKFSPENIEQAIEWSNHNLKEEEQQFVNQLIFSGLSKDRKNWEKAWNFVELVGAEKISQSELSKFFSRMSREDPVRAIDMISENLVGAEREKCLGQVLKNVSISTKNPEDMLPIIENLPEGLCKRDVEPSFFFDYYMSSEDAAVDWVINKNNKELVEHIFRRAITPERVKTIAESFLRHDANNAIITDSIVSEFSKTNESCQIAIEIFENSKSDVKTEAMAKVYDRWIEIDPVSSFTSFFENQSFPNKSDFIRKTIDSVSCIYTPNQMITILEKINDPEVTRYAAERYVWTFDGAKNPFSYKQNNIEEALKKDMPDNIKNAIMEAWESKKNNISSFGEGGIPRWKVR